MCAALAKLQALGDWHRGIVFGRKRLGIRTEPDWLEWLENMILKPEDAKRERFLRATKAYRVSGVSQDWREGKLQAAVEIWGWKDPHPMPGSRRRMAQKLPGS